MHPSDWVMRFSALVHERAFVLDLACGAGRHGRLFLEKGCLVSFLDKDISKVNDLSANPNTKLISIDLEDGSPWPVAEQSYDAIVVTNYLYRPHLSHLASSLCDGGLLIYETFGLGQEKFGRPQNPDFLLKPNELFETFKDKLNIIAFEQGCLDQQKIVQRICALKSKDPILA